MHYRYLHTSEIKPGVLAWSKDEMVVILNDCTRYDGFVIVFTVDGGYKRANKSYLGRVEDGNR